MANIHGIEVSGEIYDLEDSAARNGVQSNTSNIESIDSKIPTSASSSNKLATENDIPDVANVVESGNNNAVSSDAVFNFVKTKQFKGAGGVTVEKGHVYLTEITWAGVSSNAWILARVRIDDSGNGEVTPIVSGTYSPIPSVSVSNGVISGAKLGSIAPWIYATDIGNYWN